MGAIKVLKTILFGYLGSGIAGLCLGVAAFAYGMGPQDTVLVAPYFGIAGGVAGATYGALGGRQRQARARS